MRRAAFALLALAACEERGTIAVHASDPCAPAAATAIAVYLKVAGDCGPDTVTCGLAGFECADGCTALCPGGYCTADEWRAGIAIDPPGPGTYALIVSYRYGGAADEGVSCHLVEVHADGTTSATLAPADAVAACCGGGS